MEKSVSRGTDTWSPALRRRPVFFRVLSGRGMLLIAGGVLFAAAVGCGASRHPGRRTESPAKEATASPASMPHAEESASEPASWEENKSEKPTAASHPSGEGLPPSENDPQTSQPESSSNESGRSSARGDGSSERQGKEAVVKVAIHDVKFDPAEIVIKPGTKVVWTNEDAFEHDVTSGKSYNGREARGMKQTKFPDGKFQSGLFGQNKSFAHTFTERGTFDYYCNIHPFMVGKVIVK